MFINNIDPVLFKIGIFEVRYYGVIFLFGFIISYFMIVYLANKKQLALKKSDVEDLLLYLAIGVIIGARLFEIIFYEPRYFFSNPLEIFKVWKGGLSFHGGLFGVIIAAIIFCKKKNINFLELADIVVIPASLGLMLGRIGNFLNSELVGKVTNLWWGVNFNNEGGNNPVFRHPTQLYESFKNFLIFAVLWSLKDKKFPKGFFFGLFILMYSTLRFIIEFWKEPSPENFLLYGLTMGQILNIFMFIGGLIFIARIYKNVSKTTGHRPVA